MLSGAVTGNSSSAAGSGAGFAARLERGLTAASATLRGRGVASADLSAGLTPGVAAKDGFGFGIGIGSIAAMTIGAVAGGATAVATFCGVAIVEDCLSGVMATSGGAAVVVLGDCATGFSGTTMTGVLGAALGGGA